MGPASDASPHRLTDRDRLLLELAAENRLVLAAHAGRLLGISTQAAARRLRALRELRLVVRDPAPRGQPASWRATASGLRAVGSRLAAAPRPREGTFRHEVGVTWLYVAARRGAFGPLQEILSERRMSSEDSTREGREQPSAVRLPGLAADGSERLHYPDLLLHTASGHRVALELELSVKERARRERILSGYALDRRIDAVVYLVESRSAGRTIARTAARLGVSDLVSAQMVSLPSRRACTSGQRARTAERRAAGREGR